MLFNFKIVEKKNLWFFISLIIISIGIGTMINRSYNSQQFLNFGIDFLGGRSTIIKFTEFTNKEIIETKDKSSRDILIINSVRSALKQSNLDKSSIQISSDDEVIIKTLKVKEYSNDQFLEIFKKTIGSYEILEIDFIGPSIGSELKQKAILLVSIISLILLLYITIRFELVFGFAALLALLHDTLITISLASILSLEINTAFIAAILTILGYSINDTIIIFDRLRENLKEMRGSTIDVIANSSLNQTLLRTINTSLTTVLVISSLIFFGGTTIKEFCIVLLIGILSGTYSSLFIAAPVITSLHKEEAPE